MHERRAHAWNYREGALMVTYWLMKGVAALLMGALAACLAVLICIMLRMAYLVFMGRYD